MRRTLACVALVLTTVMSSAGLASAQAAPEFKLGFAGLAQMIPSIVGAPVENEHPDATTGDTIQRTTTGMLVWRKSDNVTVFTDGATTWLLGPVGLQSRPNGTSLDWEKTTAPTAPPPAPAAPFPTATAPVEPAALPLDAVSVRFSRSGSSWLGQGSVRNSMDRPVDMEIDFVGYDAGGHPVVDAATVFIPSLAAGASKQISVRAPAVADVAQWKTSFASWPVSSRDSFSMDVGGSSPLKVDPALASAVNALKTLDEGRWLLKVAADHQIVVAEDYTGPGVLGSFDPGTGDVVISTDLEDTSAYARASVLAHELSHANNAAAGIASDTPIQCYKEEAQAFTRQSQIWTALWNNNLPSGQIDQYHAELNDIATTVTSDPQGFATQLVSRYRSECGPIANGSAGAILPNP